MTEARYNSDSPSHDKMMALSGLQRQKDKGRQSLLVQSWLLISCLYDDLYKREDGAFFVMR